MSTLLSSSLLSWLRCFEASARHCNFTHAATELCVTQGAVSQQVKQLEQWLDRPLFLRTPRALVLTPEGERLRFVLRESFQAIEGTLTQLRKPREAGPIALSCAPSFAMRWLTPRLGDFFRDHPEVGLRVYGEFHALDRTRMVRDGIDAAVRFDLGGYEDLKARLFLDEWLLPVASPAFLAAHPELRRPQDLRGAWPCMASCCSWPRSRDCSMRSSSRSRSRSSSGISPTSSGSRWRTSRPSSARTAIAR